MAKSDFLRRVGAVQVLIEIAERFGRIDLDRSRSEKERNHGLLIRRAVRIDTVSLAYSAE